MVDCGRKWGIPMLMGEFHHNIDDKNRLVIPSKFRSELGEQFVITRGLDKCLFIYSYSEWNKIVDKLKTLPFTQRDARNFTRFFLSSAALCEFDRSGRVFITSPLIEYADITKECVIIGVNERLEIWSLEEFNNYMKVNEESLEEITEDIFDSNYEA